MHTETQTFDTFGWRYLILNLIVLLGLALLPYLAYIAKLIFM